MKTAKTNERHEDAIYMQYEYVLSAMAELTSHLVRFTHAPQERVLSAQNIDMCLRETQEEIEKLVRIASLDFDKRR